MYALDLKGRLSFPSAFFSKNILPRYQKLVRNPSFIKNIPTLLILQFC